MKKLLFIFSGLFLVWLGYFIGNILPLDYLRPKILVKEISLNDLYTRVITTIGTIGTFSAIIVALFKEDIRRIFEKAVIKINFFDADKISEITELENASNSGMTANVTATKYESVIALQNIGNIPAKGCQVILEKVEFKGANEAEYTNLKMDGFHLSIKNREEKSLLISATAKVFISAFEILSPSSETVSSDSENVSSISQLKIGGYDIPIVDYRGDYKVFIAVYSENASPSFFSFQINWNGNWHNRLSEMKKCVKVKEN